MDPTTAAFVPDPVDLRATAAERRDAGRERRSRVPRSTLAELPARPEGFDPLALLAEQHVDRVPDLVPVRMGRMAQSAYAFFRGAALIMADDLARTPTTGLTVEACGDAHVANFGGFASPERREVFDLNDFDETLPGPWEWDLRRLLASAAVASTDFGHGAQTARVVTAIAREYCDTMQRRAAAPVLDTWYRQIEVGEILPHLAREQRRATERAMRTMRTRTSWQHLPKVTELSDRGRRIVERPPFVTHVGVSADQRDELMDLTRTYVASLPPERRIVLERFRIVDAARKVVGVGSVGTRCFIVLLMTPDGEPLFLQVKEAPPSVLERYCGPFPGTGGERVVIGQRSIQATSDIFLGWTTGFGRDFYVRQLRDWKFSVDLAGLRPDGLETYGRLCAIALGRAHARTGDAAAIAGYVGRGNAIVRALTEWSMRYADRTRADHARLVDAIADGSVEAATEV